MDIGGSSGGCDCSCHGSYSSGGHSASGCEAGSHGGGYGGGSYSSGKDAPCNCGYSGNGTTTVSGSHISHHTDGAHISHEKDGSGYHATVHDTTGKGGHIIVERK